VEEAPSKRRFWDRKFMMKRRNVVMGVILASVLIAAIVIQATFGVGTGIGIVPRDIEVKSNTTITYTITLYSQDGDWFDVTIIPDTCSKGWFEWPKKEQVYVAPNREKQLSLDVTPTDDGSFKFQVRAISTINPAAQGLATALITSKPPPSPPGPTPTAGPTTCIGLEPDLPSSQKIMTKKGTKGITWTAFACSPDEDTLEYMFCVHRVGSLGWNCTPEWSTSNKWTWPATLHSNYHLTDNPVAHYDIAVHVRDAKYKTGSTVTDYDCEKVYYDYEITANLPPYCACLIPDKTPPQDIGTAITWTACALDLEGGDQDTLYYKFLVDDVTQQEWSEKNTWTWRTINTAGVGYHWVEVWVRDSWDPPLPGDLSPDDYAIFEYLLV